MYLTWRDPDPLTGGKSVFVPSGNCFQFLLPKGSWGKIQLPQRKKELIVVASAMPGGSQQAPKPSSRGKSRKMRTWDENAYLAAVAKLHSQNDKSKCVWMADEHGRLVRREPSPSSASARGANPQTKWRVPSGT